MIAVCLCPPCSSHRYVLTHAAPLEHDALVLRVWCESVAGGNLEARDAFVCAASACELLKDQASPTAPMLGQPYSRRMEYRCKSGWVGRVMGV